MQLRFQRGDDAAKLASLRRMQAIALALLLVMGALLVVTSMTVANHPWTGWLRAFAEAAVVGAVADWFAVVALFRHPLGLPVPHTAIIPTNKDRIGESLGHFVEENFLTPENVMRRLEGVNLSRAAGAWLAERANSERAAAGVCAVVPRVLAMIEDEDVARFLTRLLLGELEKVNLASAAGEALEVITASDQYPALVDDALHALERLIVEYRELILEKFGEASKYTPEFVDRYIVDKFVAGIIRLLHEVSSDPQHELRFRLDAATRDLVVRLKTSREMSERAAVFKQHLIEHLRTKPYYAAIWADVKARVLADVAAPDSRLREAIASMLTSLGAGLARDDAMQAKLNGALLGALETLMVSHGHQISLLITDVVRSWDAREVSAKVELEIGKDLQFIRLNGTLVGGCVGVLLHAAAVL